MEILRDFDQLLEERQHQTIQVGGQQWQVPAGTTLGCTDVMLEGIESRSRAVIINSQKTRRISCSYHVLRR